MDRVHRPMKGKTKEKKEKEMKRINIIKNLDLGDLQENTMVVLVGGG